MCGNRLPLVSKVQTFLFLLEFEVAYKITIILRLHTISQHIDMVTLSANSYIDPPLLADHSQSHNQPH